MTQPNFNNNGDFDWEDSGSLLWNELDWQQYLKASDAETSRFIACYLNHRGEPNHIDEVARRLGWDVMELFSNVDEDDHEPKWLGAPENEEIKRPFLADGLPYTVHRHPVFIATRGLGIHLGRIWSQFFAHNILSLPATFAWSFFGAFHSAELNAMMAIHAVDFGDFNLAICHMKNGLTAINHTFRLIQQIPAPVAQDAEKLLADTRAVLFDLREIWLRVIQDCREEDRFTKNGGMDDDDD